MALATEQLAGYLQTHFLQPWHTEGRPIDLTRLQVRALACVLLCYVRRAACAVGVCGSACACACACATRVPVCDGQRRTRVCVCVCEQELVSRFAEHMGKLAAPASHPL